MTYLQVVFLAIIQGLTEFFPVSSSGHLVLVQNLFKLEFPPVLFDILVHTGTLGAVIVFFRKDLRNLFIGVISNKKEEKRFLFLLLLASIPAGLTGFFLNKSAEVLFSSSRMVGFSLLFTSFLLFLTKVLEAKKIRSVSKLDAFIIGAFQALAILPGVSRSGSTIAAGMFRGISREVAFKFSFLLSIPAIIGALVLQLPQIMDKEALFLNQGFLGMFISFFVGLFSLRMLGELVIKSKLWIFGFYCLFLGFFVLIF